MRPERLSERPAIMRELELKVFSVECTQGADVIGEDTHAYPPCCACMELQSIGFLYSTRVLQGGPKLQEITQATEFRTTPRPSNEPSPSVPPALPEGTTDAWCGDRSELRNLSGSDDSDGPKVERDAAEVDMDAKEGTEPPLEML